MTNNTGTCGIGLVAAFCQSLLDEQIAFVNRKMEDLPPRTPQEQAEMEWDEELMDVR